MQDKYEVLQNYFGYTEFRGGQGELIDAILAGRDAVGIMPTGAGKSLCYQVPALLLEGITLVVSPLISLMKDQVTALVQAGVPAAYINSSLTAAQVRRVLENARYGQYKLIYIAPERLLTERFLETVEELDISLVAVDEAHCVSQWGQDFRPSYLDISAFLARMDKRPRVAAFTATATHQVKDDVIDMLALNNPFTVTTGFDRTNLYFEVRHPQNRSGEMLRFVQARRKKSGVIYCLTRKEVERVCELLQKNDLPATRYHAGLSEQERQENQERFQDDITPIMVATNAFGMGIDKSNVSYVLHVGMPKNLESYYQEAGRAGRDGSPAECVLLFAERDVATNTFFIEQADRDQEGLDQETVEMIQARDKERLWKMVGYCKTQACLRKYILAYFGESGPDTCGNCYNCTHDFETRDITVEAQKILSCVKRMNERFGKAILIDTLKGKETGKAVEWGLDRLTTYGALNNLTNKQIRELVDNLVDMDYLYVTKSDVRRGEFPVVKLGEKARAVLFDGQRVEIQVVHEPKPEKVRKSRQKAVTDPSSMYGNTLFQQLKALRTDFAKAQKIPPYMVFSDAALAEMSRALPNSEEAFLGISGVGKTKLEKYGTAFLAVIEAYKNQSQADAIIRRTKTAPPTDIPPDKSWSAYETAMLEVEAEGGMPLEEIATIHERPVEEIEARLTAMGYTL